MEHTSAFTAGGTTAILSTTKVFADALAEWQADLGGAYTVAWNAATNSVKISNSGVFVLSFLGNLHNALGFSSASGHSGATSYTGDAQALGRYDVLKIELDTQQRSICGAIVTGARRCWRSATTTCTARGSG